MTEYRKRKDSDAWHWCKNCSNWPTSNYDTVNTSGTTSSGLPTRPTTGELDNECRSKEREGNCRT